MHIRLDLRSGAAALPTYGTDHCSATPPFPDLHRTLDCASYSARPFRTAPFTAVVRFHQSLALSVRTPCAQQSTLVTKRPTRSSLQRTRWFSGASQDETLRRWRDRPSSFRLYRLPGFENGARFRTFVLYQSAFDSPAYGAFSVALKSPGDSTGSSSGRPPEPQCQTSRKVPTGRPSQLAKRQGGPILVTRPTGAEDQRKGGSE